jgi:hypothetical protein
VSSGTTQKLHPIPPATEVDDGWSLGSEDPKKAIDPSAETRKLQSMPRLATPITEEADGYSLATARTIELPKPALGSPLPTLKRANDPAAETQNLKKPVPSYWSEASLPRPMARLAEGTVPEHHPPADLRHDGESREIKSDGPENDGGFSEADRAFFAEGEALASKKITVEEFVDLADRELSFWQRFWRR